MIPASPTASTHGSRSQERQIVLVVHGLGDQQPGATVEEFVRERARRSAADLTERRVLHLLEETSQEGSYTEKPFPSHVWRLRKDEKEALFAEVFWADISPLPGGIRGALVGLVQLIFGLHHVAGHAAWAGIDDFKKYGIDPSLNSLRRSVKLAARYLTSPSFALHSLARAVALTLRGPVAALALLLTLVMVMTALFLFVRADEERLPLAAAAMILIGLLASLVGWSVARFRQTSSSRRRLALLLVIGGPVIVLLSLGCLLLRHESDLAATSFAAIGVATSMVGWTYRLSSHRNPVLRGVALWLGLSGLLVALVPVAPVLLADESMFQAWDRTVQFRIHGLDASKDLSHGLAWHCLAVADLLAIPLAFTALLLVAMAAVWGWAAIRADAIARPALAVSYVGTALSTGLFLIAVPSVWLVAAEMLPWSSDFKDVVSRAAPLMFAAWSGALLVMLAGALTYFFRWRWARKQDETDQGTHPPRLILAGAISASLVFLSVAGALVSLGLFFLWVLYILGDPSPTIRDQVLPWLRERTSEFHVTILAGIAFAGTVGLGGLIADKLRVALDIAMDVVNHFRREWGQDRDGNRERDTFRKYRIRARLQAVLRVMNTEIPAEIRAPSLAIVAHSQGTVTSIDVLNNHSTDLLKGFDEKTLVTMGSPFSHLYQHYFPHEYPSLDDPKKYLKLHASLSRWLNIFRIDDFVGTHIDWQTELEQTSRRMESGPAGTSEVPSPGTLLENKPVGRGGHMGYWVDPRVHEILDEVLVV